MRGVHGRSLTCWEEGARVCVMSMDAVTLLSIGREKEAASLSLSLTEVGEEVGWGGPLVYHNGTGLGLLAALVTRVVSRKGP